MRLRLLAVLTVVLLALGLVVAGATAASAHTCFWGSYPVHYVDPDGGHHCLSGTGYDQYGPFHVRADPTKLGRQPAPDYRRNTSHVTRPRP